MASKQWGKCEGCKMWEIEPEAVITDTTMGLCVAEDLEQFQIRVSGDSGCNLYKHGEVQRAVGASLAPPAPVESD